MATLISTEPATGDTLWTGETGDVDAEVARARAAWAGWASRPLARTTFGITFSAWNFSSSTH